MKTLLRGKYLVRNPLANGCLRLIDCIFRVKEKTTSISDPKKILVCNIAHLGDVLIATSVFPVLKDAYPQSEIGFLTSSSSSCVVEGHPLLDYIHTVDHWKLNRASIARWKKYLLYRRSYQKALAEIRMSNYDLAIDLYPYFPNAASLLWRAHVPVRIGYTSGGFGSLFTHRLPWKDLAQHVSDYHMDLLKLLSKKLNHKYLLYNLQAPLPEVVEHVRALLPEEYREKGFVVLQVGVGAPGKACAQEQWRALVELLVKKGIPLVFTGKGKKEFVAIEEVTRGLSGCCNLCDRLDWRQFCALTVQAKLVVSADSCLTHVAEAFSVPAIVLMAEHPYPLHTIHWKPPHALAFSHPTTTEQLLAIAENIVRFFWTERA